jgi:hypothetical protein
VTSYSLSNKDLQMLNEDVKEEIDLDNREDKVDINNWIIKFSFLI